VKDLKTRFLAAIGYVCAAGQSPAEAFDRLRVTNPNAFPVPRGNESFLAACADVVRSHEARQVPEQPEAYHDGYDN
jgi:hypothetical protein